MTWLYLLGAFTLGFVAGCYLMLGAEAAVSRFLRGDE